MQQRSSSAGLTLHFLLFVLAIAGISAGVSVQASAQTPPSASSAESYILGPNDRIRLKVYGESDITGEYEIDKTGKQYKNEFSIMQTTPAGLEVVYPKAVATARPLYPVPAFQERQ